MQTFKQTVLAKYDIAEEQSSKADNKDRSGFSKILG